jgi:sterol desaturase/sphingolipid hydroxylase (fatty acid hydroxylase superfamily)
MEQDADPAPTDRTEMKSWARWRPGLLKLLALIVALAAGFLFAAANHRGILTSLSPVFSHPLLAALGGGLGTFFLAITTVYALELYFIGYQRSSLQMLLRFDHQIRYDLLWALLPWMPVYTGIWYVMTFGVDLVEWPWMRHLKDVFPIAAIAFFPLQLVVIELLSSFLQYWQHRALHSIPMLWETHKFHHSAEQMTTLNFLRETPFTLTVDAAIIALPRAIAGSFVFPAEPTLIDHSAYALYLALTTFTALNQYFIHSNLNVSYGWFGRYVVVSPVNHRVHHSILPVHHGKNFSVSLVLWDRVFGTFHEGTDPLSRNCPIGYEGNIYNKSKWIAVEYFYPTYAFFVALYRDVARAGRWLVGMRSPGRAQATASPDRSSAVS